MSLLQNKWVVTVMAAAAVGVLVHQFWPKSSAPGPGRTAARPSTRPATPGTGTTQTVATAVAPTRPLQPADRNYLASRFREWRDSPVRDPFELFPGELTVRVDPPVYAEELLSLTAVWRQTGNRLAVVNNQVVGERDVIEGFEIQSIGGDFIWVNGPNGRERVPFGPRTVRPSTNRVEGSSRPAAR